VLQWLIESGIDLTVRNSQGKRAVDVARRYGNKSCVKVLGGNPGMCIDKSLLLWHCGLATYSLTFIYKHTPLPPPGSYIQ